MNKLNYPTWLVPLDIAKELKETGFDGRCLFAFDTEKNDLFLIQREKKACVWYEDISLLFKDINIGTQCAFYHLDIKEGHTFSYFAKKYEKAREGLVMKLIEVHKEFGNNIKRK